MLGAPELDAGVQVGSDESGVKGQNPLPRPAGHAALDAAQGTGGFLGCRRTLPAHGDLLIHHTWQLLAPALAQSPLLALGPCSLSSGFWSLGWTWWFLGRGLWGRQSQHGQEQLW